jgi:Zn-dependent protease
MRSLFTQGVPLGRWLGIPVYLHWSWVILFAFILVASPNFALIYGGLFFLVLLHELGHCLAARYFDAPTDNITLWPFGGVASIKIPHKPKEEFFVAAAGPAVNALLIPLFAVLTYILPDGSVSKFCTQLGYYNIVLLVFNLIPAFPMDGGRLLRSFLSMALQDHLKATLIAARIGQVLCIGFGILGVVSGAFMLVVIAFFIFMAAQAELNVARAMNAASVLTGEHFTDFWEAQKAIERRLREIDERAREAELDGTGV